MKIGLLAAKNHPLLSYFSKEILNNNLNAELFFILDKKAFSDKDQKIFQDRTNNAFPNLSNTNYFNTQQYIEVENHNSVKCIQAVQKSSIELLVNVGTPRKIELPLIQSAPYGVLNVHPGILPKYRGASCCEWAIYLDEPVGVSAHFMDENIDSGPIIFTKKLPVKKFQTYSDIRINLYHLTIQTCAEAIALISENNIKSDQLTPQPIQKEFFKPIPQELFNKVKEKLNLGQYKYAE